MIDRRLEGSARTGGFGSVGRVGSVASSVATRWWFGRRREIVAKAKAKVVVILPSQD